MKKKKYIVIVCVIIVALLAGFYFYNKSNNASNATTSNTKGSLKKQEENQGKKNEADAKEVANKKEEEKKAIEGTTAVKPEVAQDTVKKLIDSIYFKKGTYEEYKALFSLPDRVASKEKFEDARNSLKIADKFGKDYKSSDEIAKHFTIAKKDNMTDVNFKSEDGQKETKWQVVEKNGKYFIYNAVADK